MTALQKFLSHDPLTRFLFDDLNATLLQATPAGYLRRNAESAAVQPAAEIYESDAHYYLQLDIPGIPKDEISVEVENGRLVVRGERKQNVPQEGAKRIFSSRPRLKFEESFTLPENADQEKISGSYKDGVLSVTIEKRKKPEPVKIRLAADA